MRDFFIKNGPFPASFSLFLSLQYSCGIQMFNKFCRWLDSNRGPMVLEATALQTEPQPLPKIDSLIAPLKFSASFAESLKNILIKCNRFKECVECCTENSFSCARYIIRWFKKEFNTNTKDCYWHFTGCAVALPSMQK